MYFWIATLGAMNAVTDVFYPIVFHVFVIICIRGLCQSISCEVADMILKVARNQETKVCVQKHFTCHAAKSPYN